MIFVTLGSQKFPFNRLLQAVDTLIEQGVITQPVFAQTGASDYRPRHYESRAFLDRDEFQRRVGQCSALITHGGTGVIVGAIKQGKKVIAVPRLARYKEHVDDHQIQLIRQFDQQKLILPCYEVEDLEQTIRQLEAFTPTPYRSNTQAILDDLTQYLRSLE